MMKRSILSPRLPTSWAFTMAVGMGLSAISMAVQAQEKVLRIAMTAAVGQGVVHRDAGEPVALKALPFRRKRKSCALP